MILFSLCACIKACMTDLSESVLAGEILFCQLQELTVR